MSFSFQAEESHRNDVQEMESELRQLERKKTEFEAEQREESASQVGKCFVQGC